MGLYCEVSIGPGKREIEMRHLVIVASLLLGPGAAFAQAPDLPTISQVVEAPAAAVSTGDYYVLVVSAGAVLGLLVASSITGGIVVPVIGGVVGGYLGDWAYRN
jgi:hypothetical protein